MSEVLIIVPARGGSKRLPGKNIRPLAGRSLIAHTAEAIESAGLECPVVLSTDDDAIAQEGLRVGFRVPFRRPAELATDSASSVWAVLHALDWYRSEKGHDPDAVMVLQPTSPLRGAACLKAALVALDGRPRIDSIIAVTALHLSPGHLLMRDAGGFAHPLIEGDDRTPVLVPNGALYLTRTWALRRENTLYAGAVFPLVLNRLRAVDIDTEADWQLAEAIIARGLPPDADPFLPAPSAAAPLA